MTAGVAIYQAPQAAYDIFDKALVLYEGRQIFFGSCLHAKEYFIEMGFDCPERQTTADFLTSMTSPAERRVRQGFENKVPRTPDEFAQRWKDSPERATLMEEIEKYDNDHPVGGEDLKRFQESMAAQKAKRQRPKSPYTLNYRQQVELCLWRGFRRLSADPSLTVSNPSPLMYCNQSWSVRDVLAPGLLEVDNIGHGVLPMYFHSSIMISADGTYRD